MSRLNSLTKLANRFYFQALAAQNAQLEQYFDCMIREMIGLVRGADVSVKHLMSLPRYQHSKTLPQMLQQFAELTNAIVNLSPQDPAANLGTVESKLSELSFYTSANNAGTGYDPITFTREGGYSPPAYYVSTLTDIVRQMKSKLPAVSDETHIPEGQR